jgi:excisionase family DNA binding protein
MTTPNRQAIPYVRGREKLLTMRQVAERLNISRPYAYRLKDEGALGQIVTIGNAVRVTEAGFLAYYLSRMEPSEKGFTKKHE